MPKLAHKPKSLDLRAIAFGVLKKNFKKAKVSDVHVIEERDFDGADILRVSAMVSPSITGAQLGDAIGDLRTAFGEQGLDHFVVLSVTDASEDLSDVEE